MAADAEEEKKLEEARQKIAFVPPPSTYEDWTGTKYATTHRCFGKPCETFVQIQQPDDSESSESEDEDDSLQVQTNREWKFNLGDVQEHKYANQKAWTEGELPHELTAPIDDVHKLVFDHFDPDMKPKDLDGPATNTTGDFKSVWAQHEEAEEAAHKAMMEAYSRPYKTVREALIDDWTGTKFAENWKTFGQPDPDAPAPTAQKLTEDGKSTGIPFHKPPKAADEEDKKEESTFLQTEPKKAREWTFNLGDMQEHKYGNGNAWEQGALPHHATAPIEDVHKIVYEHFDPDHNKGEGDFKSAWAIHEEQEEADHKAMMEAHSRPYKPVRDDLINDWTGHKFAVNWKTYGQPDPDAPPPAAEELDAQGKSTGKPFHKPKTEEAAPEKESFLMVSGDPFDPHLADVDKIMQRYKEQDAEKELAEAQFKVEGDPTGGISKIHAASIQHN